jgi:integral membrane protein
MAEGISYLLLLCIAMPLKYYFGMPDAVKATGWIHGILFMLYLVYLVKAESILKWGKMEFFAGLMASLVPFGPFFLEGKLKKAQLELKQAGV